MPKYNIGKLNDLYRSAETCDKEIFAEMRSNLLLVSGEHYKKTSKDLFERLRNSKQPEQSKIRLVKNHTQVVMSEYKNQILSAAPWVTPLPHNENELQDQKSAELHKAVWQDARSRHKLKEKIRDWVEDFIDMGECAVKVFFDPNKGAFKGYKQALNEFGEPMFDEFGQPISSKTPVFEGDVVFETILPFNLLRDPNSESMDESPYLIYRKMVPISELKKMVGDDQDKLELIQENSEQTFKVFDANKCEYVEQKDSVMVREYFYRPCVDYPNGYYYITIETGILFEGELPFGIFPIRHKTFDKVQTSCRGRSKIKHLRPVQAEINRAASSIAQTQITLGDDKVFTQNGSKITKGLNHPGLRHYNVTGSAPTIVQGRSGEQFFNYLLSQVKEIYQIGQVAELLEDKKHVQDPQAMLFANIRQKKRFSYYAEKFEDFLLDVCELYLETARHYFTPEKIVRAVGRREAINIEEFKAASKFDYRIKVEPVSDDIETMMGKQLNLQFILQYVGKNLDEETIGKIVRLMPFLNGEQLLDDLTIKYDNITNDILALDRGKQVPPHKYDDHPYVINKLVHRTKLADFAFLPQEVQYNYESKIAAHEELEAQKQKDLLEAQSGFIPSGGGISKVDMYETYTTSTGKKSQRRMVLPSEALLWLKNRLEKQGTSQDRLQDMNTQAQAEIGNFLNQMQPQGMDPMATQAIPQYDQNQIIGGNL